MPCSLTASHAVRSPHMPHSPSACAQLGGSVALIAALKADPSLLHAMLLQGRAALARSTWRCGTRLKWRSRHAEQRVCARCHTACLAQHERR